jgi:hypothetical protein
VKKFWLTVAHVAVIGAGTAGAILMPAAIPVIIPGMGALNALIPSPLSKVSFDIETGNVAKITAQKEPTK